jgi:hypothetical protein
VLCSRACPNRDRSLRRLGGPSRRGPHVPLAGEGPSEGYASNGPTLLNALSAKNMHPVH